MPEQVIFIHSFNAFDSVLFIINFCCTSAVCMYLLKSLAEERGWGGENMIIVKHA